MKYGKIENYKVVGTCLMQTDDFPDVIPDEAELLDHIVGDTIYKVEDYKNKVISVNGDKVMWSDDINTINAEADNKRRAAYIAESDPLFFKEQRGEVPAGTWAKAVEEIKAKFPKVLN